MRRYRKRAPAVSTLKARQVYSLLVIPPSLPPKAPEEAPLPLRERAARFVADPRFDLIVLVLILLSIALLIAEMALHRHQPYEMWCYLAGQTITLLFVVELSVRYWVSRRPGRFLRNYWLDLLSCLSLLHFPGLRVLRTFRVLRLLRLLRLFRAAGVLSRRYAAFADFMRRGVAEYAIVGLALALVLFLGTVGVLHFEMADPRSPIRTMEDAFWWSAYYMLTGQPQGEGGFPVTREGRAFALLVSLAALAVTATFTGVVSALMIERIRRRGEVEPMEIEDLADHIVICGWSRAGAFLVEDLNADRNESQRAIVVVANLEKAPEFDLTRVRRDRVFFLRGDFTRVEMLRSARIETAAKAVLLPEKVSGLSDQDRDARTVLAALTIEKMNPRIYTCAALLTHEAEEHLRLVGVEEVVVPDDTEAALLATATIHRGVVTMLHEMASPRKGGWIEKRPIPASWIGKPFVETAAWLKRERNELLLGVETEINSKGRGRILLNPPADRPGAAGDLFICLVTPTPGSPAPSPWPA
ncbi:MAG: ion transporter [Planctomycetes bacterium]|nr:ion transporter [Planctomycetota bacterium]